MNHDSLFFLTQQVTKLNAPQEHIPILDGCSVKTATRVIFVRCSRPHLHQMALVRQEDIAMENSGNHVRLVHIITLPARLRKMIVTPVQQVQDFITIQVFAIQISIH